MITITDQKTMHVFGNGTVGFVIRTAEPMRLHTSFAIGGNAEFYVEASCMSQLSKSLEWARAQHKPVFILGAGTNILVSDRGITGLVVKMKDEFNEVRIDGSKLVAGASAKLGTAIKLSLLNGLTGLECLSGIPGTVGGAVCMNAGTYAGCVKDTLDTVTVITDDGKIREIDAQDLDLRYRGSIIKDRAMIVVQAVFKLDRGSVDDARELIRQLSIKRQTSHPSGRTAGSVFKNPQGEYAGRLLESIGAKGLRIGDAMVSAKHANFIENIGNASANDVASLVRVLMEMAREKLGVNLEPEIQFVGEWD